MIVVSNTSPITNLAAIGKLHLLQQIYNTIIIPQAVYEEMVSLDYPVPGSTEVQTLSWIQTQQINNYPLVAQLQTEIDPGESEAIVLAIELKADRLIIDDYKARVVATRLGLKFTGLLGILLLAKNQELIVSVQPILDALINQANFRVSHQVYSRILRSANEG